MEKYINIPGMETDLKKPEIHSMLEAAIELLELHSDNTPMVDESAYKHAMDKLGTAYGISKIYDAVTNLIMNTDSTNTEELSKKVAYYSLLLYSYCISIHKKDNNE